MKHVRFDERLDSILVRAAIRLQERMEFAQRKGRLPELLMRMGLAAGLGASACQGSLLEVQDKAVVLLARNIREARQKGFLRNYLAAIHMEELLHPARPGERPVLAGLHGVEADHPQSATVISLESFR